MKINREDVKRFMKKYNLHKTNDVVLTKKFVLDLSQKERLCFICLATMQFGRSVEKSLENANCKYPVSDKTIESFFSYDTEGI